MLNYDLVKYHSIPEDSEITVLPIETFTGCNSCNINQNISWVSYNRKAHIELEKTRKPKIATNLNITIEDKLLFPVKYPKKSHLTLRKKSLSRLNEEKGFKQEENNKIYNIEDISFLLI